MPKHALNQLLCLALPRSRSGPQPSCEVRWLVRPGEAVHAGQAIARIVGDRTYDLRTPQGVHGTLRALLVDDGACVAPGNPLLTLLPDNDSVPSSDQSGELAEDASRYAPAQPGDSIFAEVTDMNRVRAIATVGLISLLGFATTIVTSVVYVLLGGTTPLLVGALALSVVAVALLYGERKLHGHDGYPG